MQRSCLQLILYTIIEKLCDSHINYSSVIDYMREKYNRVLTTLIKTKRDSRTKFEEDTRSSQVNVDQCLQDFIPNNTEPAR